MESSSQKDSIRTDEGQATLDNANRINSENVDHESRKYADELTKKLVKEIEEDDDEFWGDSEPSKVAKINEGKKDTPDETEHSDAIDLERKQLKEAGTIIHEEHPNKQGAGDLNPPREKTIEELFRAGKQTDATRSTPTTGRLSANKVAPFEGIQATGNVITKPNKPRRGSKIKCAKNYRQIAAEKAKKGIRGAANIAKTVVAEALPEPFADIMDGPKEVIPRGHSAGGKRPLEEDQSEVKAEIPKEKKRCKIKTSKTYKQIIAEKSKKAAKFAAKKAHSTAMQYAGAYVPQPMMQKLNNKLADRGFISPAYSRMDTESPYSPNYSPKRRPYSGLKKKSKVKIVRKKERRNSTKKDGDDDGWSDEDIQVEELDDEVLDDVDSREKRAELENEDSVPELPEEKNGESVNGEIPVGTERKRKSRCVSTSKRVNEKNGKELRYNKRRQRQPEKKPVLGGMNTGGGNEKSGLTAMMDQASKCTSVSGIAKTMAPKLAKGILGNKRMQKAWGSTSKKCTCCKCCTKCGSHCDTVVKIFMSVVSITVVAYDVAMAWTAFAGFYRFEGTSPLTIVFGIVCSIASLLMLLEVRNAIMTCLVSVIKVKKLQKTGEGSSFGKKIMKEEYWVETVQLLELLLGDLPIVIILALTITFASCGLYNATFKKGIVGKLALYAVFISAAWKAIMACVQFCLSKPYKRNEDGKRRYVWALFRVLRPLLALTVLFFALYIILTINGVYMNLIGKNEARLDCVDA